MVTVMGTWLWINRNTLTSIHYVSQVIMLIFINLLHLLTFSTSGAIDIL